MSETNIVALIRDFGDVRTPQGITATRVYAYIPGSGGTDVLPSVGDSYSEELPTLKVIRRERKLLGNRADCGYLYTVDYQTERFQLDFGTETPDFDDLPVSTSVSSQYLVFSASENWKWAASGEIVGANVSIPVIQTIQTIQVTMELVGGSFSDFNTLQWPVVGKINDEAWMGFGIGEVLYNGVEAYETIRTPEETDRKWILQFNFSAKIPGWNYFYNNDPLVQDYDQPQVGVPARGVYEETDFGALIAAVYGS